MFDLKTPPASNPALFTKAIFRSQSGVVFDGYVIGRGSFHAFGLFHGDDQYIFNFNLPDMMVDELTRLKSSMEAYPSELFPLTYRIDKRVPEYEEMEGEITFDERPF